MKNKKVVTLLLSLTMLASVVAMPQKAYAAESAEAGIGTTVTLSDDGQTLTFSGSGTINKKLNETTLASEDFSQVTSVVVEEGITGINAFIFEGINNVNATLSLPSSLETLGNASFSGAGLTGTLTIPENVTNIGEAAFQNNNFTGTLVIPDNVQTIGAHAFKGLDGITRIEIGSGVTSIGNEAFRTNSFVETEIVTENEVALAYDWVNAQRQAGQGAGGSNIQIQDGAGTGTTTMNGTVSTITSIDVVVPIGGINFVIDEDGQLQTQGIVIESNTAVPLSVNMVSVTPLEAGDSTEGLAATSHKAPALVLANKYTADEWNNLTKVQTEAEIAISLKQVDVTPEGEAGTELTEATTDDLKVSTPVELGDLSVKKSLAHLESGYGTAAKCAINIETSKDFTNYGKAWISADDITFRYLTTLEFAFDM